MSEANNTFNQMMDNLQDVGRTWATHGLTVGKSALEAGAETLKNTADFLDTMSDRLAHEATPEEAEVPMEEIAEEEPAAEAPTEEEPAEE